LKPLPLKVNGKTRTVNLTSNNVLYSNIKEASRGGCFFDIFF